MKNNIKKCIFTLLCIAFSMLVFCISSNASENDLTASIEADENLCTVAIYINSPEKITDIDIKLFIDKNRIQIKDSSTENTDSEKYSVSFEDFPENLETDINYFTFFSDTSAEKISFSGFFLHGFSSDDDFRLLNITLTSVDAFSDTDTITIDYKINAENSSHTATRTFFVKNGKSVYPSEPMLFLAGDVNADGKVTVLDARIILRASVGLESLDFSVLPLANTDYDNKISVSDARHTLRTAVGLEETVYHSYVIFPDENATCENGGSFTFTCTQTGKSFSLQTQKAHHIQEDKNCYSTGKCMICNEKVFAKGEHIFNDYGKCTACGADKNIISDTENNLKPLIENIASYDFAANEALKNRNYEDFVSYTVFATIELRKATEITKGINGMQSVHSNFEKAYSIRFDAILDVTDENGQIPLTAGTCNKISDAVTESNKFIDFPSAEDE